VDENGISATPQAFPAVRTHAFIDALSEQRCSAYLAAVHRDQPLPGR